MYVYFMKTIGELSLIKIGKSNCPENRMKHLQNACPLELKVIGKVKCLNETHAYHVERAAHELLKKNKYRGEWFNLSGRIESAIKDVIRLSKENYVVVEGGKVRALEAGTVSVPERKINDEPITKRQAEILDYLKTYSQTNGMPPTRAEISAQFKFKSDNAAHEHLLALMAKGFINLTPLVSRGITLVG